MDQRVQFIADDQRDVFSVAELADRFGISRTTAYKWLDRYPDSGPAGLINRSQRPKSCPHQTAADLVAAIVEVRRRHPTWGPKKLLRILTKRPPRWPWPARSTTAELLRRQGLVRTSRRRRALTHPGRPLTPMTAPHAIWTADFKGQFRTRNGISCYPLTIVDGFSRYVLACQALRSTEIALAKPVFLRLFQEYGLPQRIRTDNGVPFATTALGRLSPLSVWWIRLGIVPELIEPAHPQQNGRHERMHRTLKAEPTRPPSGNLQAQQVRFTHFQHEYTDERPHEAVHHDTPASHYVASARSLPRRLPAIEYTGHFEVRLVSRHSGIRWNHHWVCVTHTLAGEYVGLEEVDDGLWDGYFGPLKLGRMDERRLQIEDHEGRFARKKVLPMSPD